MNLLIEATKLAKEVHSVERWESMSLLEQEESIWKAMQIVCLKRIWMDLPQP